MRLIYQHHLKKHCKFAFIKTISMTATNVAPTAQNLDSLKLQILVRIAQIEDVALLRYLQSLLLESNIQDEESVSDEELEMVESRLSEFRLNPTDFVTLEDFAKKRL